MSNIPDRIVMVDLGYHTAEHLVSAKVIKSASAKNLFDDNHGEALLVELSGGERMWVSRWYECDPEGHVIYQ